MKKVLCIAISALTFAACGNSSNANKQPEEVVVTETQVTESCDSCGGCSDTKVVCSTEVVAADTTATK